jgi:protein-S-isoprenylcysteine O-methyltransferase Ste14
MRAWIYTWRGWIWGCFAIGALLLMETGESKARSDLGLDFFLQWMGPVVLGLWAVLLRKWARESIGQHSRGSSFESPELLTQGAYKSMRHPLYASNACIGSAWLLCTPLTHVYLWLLLIWSFAAFLAQSEDRYLHQKWPGVWEQWRQFTPLWSLRFPTPRMDLKSWKHWFLQDRWTLLWWFLAFGFLWVRSWFP